MRLFLNKIVTSGFIILISVSLTLSSFAGNLCRGENGKLGVEAFCIADCEENIRECDHKCCSDFDFNDSENKKCSDIDISQSFMNKRISYSPDIPILQVDVLRNIYIISDKDLNKFSTRFRNHQIHFYNSQSIHINTDILIC